MDGGVPRVTFDGSTGYPFQLSLSQLAGLGSSSLNVMAYRHQTAGTNGSIALMAPDLAADAARGGARCCWPGGRSVQPPETTFYGLGCAPFQTATDQLGQRVLPST